VQKAIQGGVDAELAREEISHGLSQAFWDNFAISDGLVKEILTRLAPFSFQEKITQHNVTAGGSPFYPLTSILDVLDQVEHPKDTIEIRNDSTIPHLWLAASVGCSTANHFGALNAKGIPATPVIASQHQESDWIRWGIQPWQDFSGKTLFAISNLGLSTVRSTRAHTFELPTVLVVGDSIQDSVCTIPCSACMAVFSGFRPGFWRIKPGSIGGCCPPCLTDVSSEGSTRLTLAF
jgi:hypothetical protein